MPLTGDDKHDHRTVISIFRAVFNGRGEEKVFLSNGAGKVSIAPAAAAAVDGKLGRGKPLRQILASFAANLGTVNTGLAFGFSALALPQLQSADSFLKVDDSQASWIASLSSAGTPVGCILSGYLMDVIGRKLTLILTEVPLVLGWLLIATAQNIWMIYVGRVLVGLGCGMVGAPARVYTCEVSQPHLRGMLGALASVGISLGVLLQYGIGSFCTWGTMAACSAVVPVLSLALMLTVPETPNYLLTRDEGESARRALVKLRGSVYNVDAEIQQMLAFKEKNHVEPLHGPRELVRALLKPSTLKPFGILALYFFMYQWSGVNAITFYAVDVFKISGATVNVKMAVIALGVVRLVFTIVGCVLLRRCGRRPLTFVSGATVNVRMAVIALGVVRLVFTIVGCVLLRRCGRRPLTFVSGATVNVRMAVIALGVVRLVFTIVGCVLLRRCGRRPLTFVSGVGCGVTMVGLGTYMYVKSCWDASGVEASWTWFPVACIFLFTVACTLGFLIVPWVMIGEVYPTQVRGVVGGMTTCSAHIFVFLVVKTYQMLKQGLHNYGTFWFYGTSSLLGCIYFYYCLPETKGRSLQEIEDYFCGRTKTLAKPKPPSAPKTTTTKDAAVDFK